MLMNAGSLASAALAWVWPQSSSTSRCKRERYKQEEKGHEDGYGLIPSVDNRLAYEVCTSCVSRYHHFCFFVLPCAPLMGLGYATAPVVLGIFGVVWVPRAEQNLPQTTNLVS